MGEQLAFRPPEPPRGNGMPDFEGFKPDLDVRVDDSWTKGLNLGRKAEDLPSPGLGGESGAAEPTSGFSVESTSGIFPESTSPENPDDMPSSRGSIEDEVSDEPSAAEDDGGTQQNYLRRHKREVITDQMNAEANAAIKARGEWRDPKEFSRKSKRIVRVQPNASQPNRLPATDEQNSGYKPVDFSRFDREGWSAIRDEGSAEFTHASTGEKLSLEEVEKRLSDNSADVVRGAAENVGFSSRIEDSEDGPVSVEEVQLADDLKLGAIIGQDGHLRDVHLEVAGNEETGSVDVVNPEETPPDVRINGEPASDEDVGRVGRVMDQIKSDLERDSGKPEDVSQPQPELEGKANKTVEVAADVSVSAEQDEAKDAADDDPPRRVVRLRRIKLVRDLSRLKSERMQMSENKKHARSLLKGLPAMHEL